MIDLCPNQQGTLTGIRVMVAVETPRMKLSADLPVTDTFRRDFDAWLLEFFGTTCTVPEGQAVMLGDSTIIVHPNTYKQMLKSTR